MTDYIFSGEVIRLNAKDYYKWRDMYKALDLAQELEQMDEEFRIRIEVEGEQKLKKKWYSECYARLNGRNKIALRNSPRPSVTDNRNDVSWAPKATRNMTIYDEMSQDWAKRN